MLSPTQSARNSCRNYGPNMHLPCQAAACCGFDVARTRLVSSGRALLDSDGPLILRDGAAVLALAAPRDEQRPAGGAAGGAAGDGDRRACSEDARDEEAETRSRSNGATSGAEPQRPPAARHGARPEQKHVPLWL